MPCTTLQVIDTEYSADVVESCPVDSFQDHVLCGTYQLKDREGAASDSPKERHGRLLLYRLNCSEESPLRETQRLDCPAVLDAKWSSVPGPNGPVLGVANAQGELILYALCADSPEVELGDPTLVENAKGRHESETPPLFLSLDWSNRVNRSDPSRIAVSQSDGCVSLWDASPGAPGLTQIECWAAHGFEAWITAFDYWNTDVVYSGGDDCLFKGWDLRVGTSSPIFTKRSHSMGVCSIHSNPHQEHMLVTGSYQENIILWDTRSMKRPVHEEEACGGGVWRLKWNPDPLHKHVLLAACMHNGFRVYDVNGDAGRAGALKRLFTIRGIRHWRMVRIGFMGNAPWDVLIRNGKTG